MPDKEANLIIKLKDEASKGLSNIKGSVLAVAAAVAGLTAFLADSIKSFLESDKVVTRLNASLRAQGIFTAELSKEMQEYAKQLQKQTTFSDEAILSAQTLLTTFGLAGAQMKQATQEALNLSAGLGIDLQTAAMLVGKAAAGATESLGRYGIKIDETTPSSEKFAAVLNQINERFGGAAAAEVESYSGRIANLKNRFDEIKESIGEAMIPALERGINTLEFFIGGIEQLGGIFPTVFATGLAVIQEFVGGLQYALEQFPFLTEALGLVGINFETVNLSLQNHIDKILEMSIQDQIVTQQKLMNSNIVTQTSVTNAKRMSDEDKKAWDKKVADSAKAQAALKKGRDEAYNEYLTQMKDLEKTEIEHNKIKAQNFQSTMQFISSLSTSKNKELAVIGKAAAIADATINTYRAVTLALASAPPPYNFALAALVGTAGFANVAKISGTQLAEGGLVMPRAGGIQATIGEAGKAEAVIPLGDERTNEKMREAGLGNTVNINISVGTLVGSNDSVRELAKMIDTELFSLRKNNESVAFEAI